MYFWFNWTFLNKWRILTDLLWSACKKQHRIGILYLHMSLAAEVMAAIRCWTNMSWSGSTGSEQKVQFNKRLGLSHRAAVVCSSSAPLCFLWLFILTCLQARERAWLRHSSFSLLCSIHTQTNQENVCINTYPHVCRFFHTLCMSAWQSPACPWFLTHWCHAVLLCRVLHVHTQRQTDTQQHTPSRQAFMTALPISWSLCCFVKSHLLLFFLFLFFLVHHFPLALTSSPTPPTSKASPIFAPSLHTFILITLLSLATFAH